jgi:hypothetical protein
VDFAGIPKDWESLGCCCCLLFVGSLPCCTGKLGSLVDHLIDLKVQRLCWVLSLVAFQSHSLSDCLLSYLHSGHQSWAFKPAALAVF